MITAAVLLLTVQGNDDKLDCVVFFFFLIYFIPRCISNIVYSNILEKWFYRIVELFKWDGLWKLHPG